MSTTPEEPQPTTTQIEPFGRKPIDKLRISAAYAFGLLQETFSNASHHKKNVGSMLPVGLSVAAGALGLASGCRGGNIEPSLTPPPFVKETDIPPTPIDLSGDPQLTPYRDYLINQGLVPRDIDLSLVTFPNQDKNSKDIVYFLYNNPNDNSNLDVLYEGLDHRIHSAPGIYYFAEKPILSSFTLFIPRTPDATKEQAGPLLTFNGLNTTDWQPLIDVGIVPPMTQEEARQAYIDGSLWPNVLFITILTPEGPQFITFDNVTKDPALFQRLKDTIDLMLGGVQAQGPIEPEPTKPKPNSTPLPTSTPEPTSTKEPSPTKEPTSTKVPEPTKAPIPKYINEGQWNGLTAEQKDIAIDQWFKGLLRDQSIKDAQVVERALPYLKMFAHEQNYPMDPDVSGIVDQIIAERGNLPWATDWRSQDYERGFFYVKTINQGATGAATNIDAFIMVAAPISRPAFAPNTFYSCSPETQKILLNLEYACGIIKEGGGSRLFWHMGRVRGQTVAQVDEYLFTTPGTMGIGEAITLPLDIGFWTWVKNNAGKISDNPGVQQELIHYADAANASVASRLEKHDVDFNPVFP